LVHGGHMANLSDIQIKSWIKNKVHFEGKSDGGGLYLSYRKTFAIPVFIFRYRFSGKQQKMKIGSYGNMSLADARKQCKELKALVSLGHDVASEKKARKSEAVAKIQAKENAFTAGQLADKYFNDQILGNWKHPNIIRAKIEKDIKPYIGNMAVDDVKPMHIDEILKTVVARGAPTVANDVLRILKKMFDYAIKRHIVRYNPASAFNTADAGGKEKAKERALSHEELILFFEAMRKAKGFSQVNQITIHLLLILGVRKNELCQARREDFNLKAGVWNLVSSKTGKFIKIPLSTQAVNLLTDLMSLTEESEWLLPSRKSQDRRLPYISESTLNVALKKVRHCLPNTEAFTIHDFRRTARTHIEALGFPPHIGERCLNHKIKGVEGIYNQYDYYDERAKALQALADFMEVCEGNTQLNIIPFRKKTG